MPTMRMCVLTTSKELLTRRDPQHQMQPRLMQRGSSALATHCRRRLRVHGMGGTGLTLCLKAVNSIQGLQKPRQPISC